MNKKLFSTLIFVSLILTLLSPFSQALADATSSVASQSVTDSIAQQNQLEAQYQDLLSKSKTNSSMQSSPTGSTNYTQAYAGCIGKIVGKYILNYLGIGISSAVNAISSLFATTGETAQTAAVAAQGISLVASVPTYSAPAYFQSTAAYALQEDARRQAQSDNTAKNFLTPLAVCIANELVQAMTAQTIQWINNGFKNPDGTKGPGFMTNPGQLFQGIADREVNGFMQGLGPIGSMICKPFDIKIRIALLGNYNQNYQPQCTLKSIKNNFENFGKSANYWGDWIQMTQQDNNNAIGSFFQANDQMQKNIIHNQNMNQLELTVNQGFLSIKKCPNGASKCDEKDKITTTPGAEVQSSLDRILTIQGNRINIANSFDDIVSALVSQLLKMAVTGLQQGNSR